MASDTNALLYVIKDLGPWHHYPTVTNRAEQVYEDTVTIRDGRKLVCLDSAGSLDIIELDGKGCAQFRSCESWWTGSHSSRVEVYSLAWRRISNHRARGSLRGEHELTALLEYWEALHPSEQQMVIDIGCVLATN